MKRTYRWTGKKDGKKISINVVVTGAGHTREKVNEVGAEMSAFAYLLLRKDLKSDDINYRPS